MLGESSIPGGLRLVSLVCLLFGCVALAASVEESESGTSTDTAGQVEVSSMRPAIVATPASSKKSRSGNPTASDRLMRELQRAYKSESYKRGLYTVDLVDESLYEWRVKVTPAMFDADSALHKDLVRLNQQGKKGHVELSFEFKDTFPFSPPSVRLVYPFVQTGRGGLFPGGILCMDIFTPKGWSSAYKIEGAILQVVTRLTELKAEVESTDPTKIAESYNPERAREGFERFMATHDEWAHKSDKDYTPSRPN